MKKLYWKLYYKFQKPKGRTEILISYCRVNGVKYSNQAISVFAPTFSDFKGVPQFTEED